MRSKVRFILTLAYLLVTSCSSSINTPQPTATALETPTQIPTITPSPILTPEPTATFTPTETPLPQIDLPIVLNPDGTPVLNSFGAAQFEFSKGFGVLPTVQELAEKFGEKPWTPGFIAKWHAYLETASVGGVPLMQPFNQNTVCTTVNWTLVNQYNPSGTWNELWLKGGTWNELWLKGGPCKKETFPLRPIAAFTDNTPTIENNTLSTPIYGVTIQIWNPITGRNEFRTFVRSQVIDPKASLLARLGTDGNYLTPIFNKAASGVDAQDDWTIQWFKKLSAEYGITVYNAALQNEAFMRDGLYAQELNNALILGTSALFRNFVTTP